MKVMILAAGRGKRLKPLTDTLPKPLVQFAGKPIIAWHLEKIAQSGFKEVVINVHWLAEQIMDYVGSGNQWGLKVKFSHEKVRALETAGGIRFALSKLGENFMVVNGDIFSDFPLESLNTREKLSKPLLVMVDNPPQHPEGDFAIESGNLSKQAENRLTFSGIARYPASVFKALPFSEPKALGPLFEQWIAQKNAQAVHHPGIWHDLGTIERIKRAEKCLTLSKTLLTE